MLYPFLFITGAISSIAGAVMGIKEDNNQELAYEADRKAGYNLSVQRRYDGNYSLLYQAYDMDKVVKEMLKDYPRMNESAAMKVISSAIAKKLMEEETDYKYKPNEDFRYFNNLEKYLKDEYRHKLVR